MKTSTLIALSILLLLAVAAPSCLASGNSVSDQQSAPQYSKLPPLQFSVSPLTQKEYFQAALWLAQYGSKAHAQLENNSLLGLTEQQATILFSPIATLIAAIISVIVALFSVWYTAVKNRETQRDIHELQKQEQENNFRFQREQASLTEKNKILINFLTSTSIDSIRSKEFMIEDIRKNKLHIDTFNDDLLSEISTQIMAVLNKQCDLHTLQYPLQNKQSEDAIQKYTSLHNKLLTYAKTISQEQLTPH